MDEVERLRAWSYARQRLGDPAATIEQALRSIVAVYSTHPTGPLSLRVRTRSFTAAGYRRLDRDRRALRIPAMRRTVFLVPREHAARIFTAVRPSSAHALRPLKRLGLSMQVYEQCAERILPAAREPLATRELEDAAGIGGRELGTVLRCLRYEGRLLTRAGDSLLMSPHRYVATSAWAPEGLDAGNPSDALAWLAGEYLRAYGPARLTDFAWWTGAAKGTAAEAIGALQTVDTGDGLRLLAEDEPAFDRIKPLRDQLELLPKWDAYTMGHAPDSRRRFVHPDVQQRVYTPIGVGLPGDGNPVVLVDGQAVATWTYTLKDGASVQPFDTLGTRTRRRIDERLDAVAGLLAS
ncbi:MAG: DNA glycosylase AlkZ-like family protein [Actinomycetota bacterium]